MSKNSILSKTYYWIFAPKLKAILKSVILKSIKVFAPKIQQLIFFLTKMEVWNSVYNDIAFLMWIQWGFPKIIIFSFRNGPFDHEQSIVRYDGTLVNAGNGMNVTTGIFTAPHPGIYAFNFHALTRDGTATYIKIMHNGRNVGGAYRRHEGEGDESHAAVVTPYHSVWKSLNKLSFVNISKMRHFSLIFKHCVIILNEAEKL